MAEFKPTVTITSNFSIVAALNSEVHIGAFRGKVVSHGMTMDNSGIEYTLVVQEMLDHYPPAQDICF